MTLNVWKVDSMLFENKTRNDFVVLFRKLLNRYLVYSYLMHNFIEEYEKH